MRAILAGGGTGGHVIPALAIARELQSRYQAELLFVGTARGIETRLVPAAGFQLRLVEVGALKNVSLATRLRTLLALPRAVWAAGKIIAEFRPHVVIGVGGYASGPAMAAAIFRRVPTLAFEPNLVPGFANRLVARLVSAAAVHFEETKRYFPRSQVTGVPVRAEFFQLPPRDLKALPSLLVFGGSQGARAINRVMREALPALRERIPSLQIVHQTGEHDFEETRSAYAAAGVAVEVLPFIDGMPAAFARADVVLCRSGASTVAEITAAGKPAIFVPFPHAADDHQRRNAEALEQAGAAIMLEEETLTAGKLVSLLEELLTDRVRLQRMAEAARRLAHPDAAREIANLAAQLAGAVVA
jgi:UDP-N-acetylglucosamine--N-acetylmuramyl-(pentapeptide) pyrophosphoryl-undecaprenol N-acetylglucosamine transferase